MKRVVLAVALVGLGCSKKGGESTRSDVVGTNSGGSADGKGGAVPGNAGPRGFSLDLDGDMEATGSVDKDTVRRVVKDNVTKLQACYEQTLMANPNIAGTVTATFTVDNGSISQIKAAGVHPDVEACVIKTVQLFKFPPGTKVDVTYPFTFKPAS